MYATNAATAYAKVSNSVLGPRSIEQKAFRQVTGMLSAASQDENVSMARLAEVVQLNSKLWTILAVDLASTHNGLPEALRAQIISLALYSQKTGRAVLRNEAQLTDLIEINTAIMDGLDGDTGAQPTRQVQ